MTEGFVSNDSEHDCDLGYVSAIIDNMRIDEVVSTEELTEHRAAIYPNPVLDHLWIDTKEFVIKDVTLINMAGLLIYAEQDISSSQYQMNCSNLIPGIYMLTIISDNGVLNKRLLKQ